MRWLDRGIHFVAVEDMARAHSCKRAKLSLPSHPMAEDLIRYDVLVQEALRGVVKKVLTEVAQAGLPGEHHFFVTFATRYPGVRISQRLLAEYPSEMTVVLQHQFWDLSVHDSAFEVGLSFKGVAETLHIPFRAIASFVDPHAGFQVKFDTTPDAKVIEAAEAEVHAPAPEAKSETEAAPAAEAGKASVVSLDAFRKKNG
jgi:hypothetical protein